MTNGSAWTVRLRLLPPHDVEKSSIFSSTIVFVCIFLSGMFGILLGKVLPDRHLDSESKDIVKLATGLIATRSALVLGLLVSTAKERFDQVNEELMQIAVKTVVLDRALAEYGPEAQAVRTLLSRAMPTRLRESYPATSLGWRNWMPPEARRG